jgi:hypothetical protein
MKSDMQAISTLYILYKPSTLASLGWLLRKLISPGKGESEKYILSRYTYYGKPFFRNLRECRVTVGVCSRSSVSDYVIGVSSSS